MQFVDCRRLTGPNSLWDRPSVVLDVACSPDEARAFQPQWEAAVLRMYAALGWDAPVFHAAPFTAGISVAFDAPIDRLYAGIAVAEWAWAECTGEAVDFDETVSAVATRADDDANPALLALHAAAVAHRVPFLWDDDLVSVGHGASALTWLPRELPAPEAVDWASRGRIRVALVTGTNGKTTTSRLIAHILRTAGYATGLTSTEGAFIDAQVLDTGDYAGPGGARMVLRDPGAQAAVLETARGGLLRRGLGVETADVALITNIAEDHLGDFGSQTMQELLDIKWVVTRAVRDAGLLVLNADDPALVQQARDYPGRIAWFSLDPDKPVHCQLRGDALYLGDERLCAAAEIPLSLGGLATHNIANALAAAAVCDGLKISIAHIREGLLTMAPDANIGRGNLYSTGGCQVLVDFAHNPHAMRAIVATARALPAPRRLLAFSQPGDRPDALIRELAREAWALDPDCVVVSELEVYARGRAPGEVVGIIRDELMRCGARDEQVVHTQTEIEALEHALAWAQPGDLVVMLALAEGAAVRARLTSQIGGAQ
ncbi:MAG: Mur ligase family protein [Gammaproteobacteria bacterium]